MWSVLRTWITAGSLVLTIALWRFDAQEMPV
jgi:hypothetical protein